MRVEQRQSRGVGALNDRDGAGIYAEHGQVRRHFRRDPATQALYFVVRSRKAQGSPEFTQHEALVRLREIPAKVHGGLRQSAISDDFQQVRHQFLPRPHGARDGIGMATSPEMAAIEHHRIAGLAGQLNIRTKPGKEF